MNRYRSAADTVGYDAIRLLNALRNLQPSMSATRGAWWHAKLPESPQVSKLLLLRDSLCRTANRGSSVPQLPVLIPQNIRRTAHAMREQVTLNGHSGSPEAPASQNKECSVHMCRRTFLRS